MRVTTAFFGSMQYALVLMLLLGSVSQSSMASAQVLERTIQGATVIGVRGFSAGDSPNAHMRKVRMAVGIVAGMAAGAGDGVLAGGSCAIGR
jgi:hypothetical protein